MSKVEVEGNQRNEWIIFLNFFKTHYVHVRLLGLWYATPKVGVDSRAGQVNMAPVQVYVITMSFQGNSRNSKVARSVLPKG